MTIKAIQAWATNADLIADCASLGYLRSGWETLDPTYGEGVFWRKWKPSVMVCTDIDPAKSPSGPPIDFTDLPFPDRSFDAVVFDPPYKLNGRPDEDLDGRYGVATRTRWQDRMALIEMGVEECARVLGDGCLLVKCQDQVVSGKMVWQTDVVTEIARREGLTKIDRLDMLSYRPQPEGRRQVHAHRCSSQLLVFTRGKLPAMTGCPQCGVGEDDDCSDECPSRWVA